MEKERDSGIELLRIFASMLVIILHFNLSGAINCSLGTNRLLLFGLESLGICAVDLFLIITGYFSAHSKKSSLLKLLDLFGQLLFLRLGFYFVEIFLFHNRLPPINGCKQPGFNTIIMESDTNFNEFGSYLFLYLLICQSF